MNDDHDAILNFLTDGLPTKERDIITRSYFGVAQGDPESAPVQIAVMFTACTRKLAQAPAEIQDANTNLKWMLDEAKKLEHRVIERVSSSNVGVLSRFQDEAARVTSNLRTMAQHSERIIMEGQQIAETMQKLLAQGESLATTLQLTKVELKTHNDSTKKIAEATASTGISVQAIKTIMASLNALSIANWLTLGIFMGFALTGIITEIEMPWWGRMLVFGVPIGVLQLVAGFSWSSVKEEAAKFPPSDKS